MSNASALLQQIRTCLGGYERAKPDSALPQWVDMGEGTHRFYCGNPRDKSQGREGLTFKQTGYTLTFEVYAEETAQGWHYRSFSVHLINVGEASILFHKDPENARWPDHPETHVQFEAPAESVQAVPFLSWRLPLGEIDPIQCLEYATARGVDTG
jgi:hypothetical protein